jgi:hypothetical protein
MTKQTAHLASSAVAEMSRVPCPFDASSLARDHQFEFPRVTVAADHRHNQVRPVENDAFIGIYRDNR